MKKEIMMRKYLVQKALGTHERPLTCREFVHIMWEYFGVEEKVMVKMDASPYCFTHFDHVRTMVRKFSQYDDV